METTDSILMSSYKSFQYIPELDSYLISDNSRIVYLFDSKGNHISNSLHCKGEGPGQYYTITNALYNPYKNQIELFNSNNRGELFCYDLRFNYLNTEKLNHDERFTAGIAQLISLDKYLLEPTHTTENSNYFISKTLNGSEERHSFPNNYVAGLNMQQSLLFKTQTSIFYTPRYLDFHFYQMDTLSGTLKPIYKIDIGNDEDIAEYLTERFGKGDSDNPRRAVSNVNIIMKKVDYLLSSSFYLPIIRLINDHYIYVHLIRKKKPLHYIYNRKNKESFFLTESASIPLSRCYQQKENALMSIIDAYELNKYINEETIKYMSETEIEKMKSIKEDDNPIIIKYILK
ncbi:MAG: hypothetical protein E7099_09170 [Mediterranea massiliensis]|nr:hypothetical protein [Mediterranea massiliensis]